MPLLTVKDCAALNLAIYGLAPAPVTWDHIDDGLNDDGVYWAIKIIDGIYVVVFRGSDSTIDWLRDLLAIAFKPWHAPSFGPVHMGFYLGMTRVWAELKTQVRPSDRVVLTGHSLGAARTPILAAEMLVDGFAPTGRVCFGEPRVGFQQFADFVAEVPTWSYRNTDGGLTHEGHDGVTGVPFYLPPAEYVPQSKLIDLTVTPASSFLPDFFRFHHMPLYYGAAPLDVVVP